MPKNLLQDMVKHTKRDVSLDSSTRKAMPFAKNKNITIKKSEIKDTYPDSAGQVKNHNNARSRYALWLVAIISVVFFLFAISYIFSKAVITLNPKMQNVVLNENLFASKDGNKEALAFDLVVISGEENKTIQTTEEKDFSQKAEGVVLIYNTFSSAPQTLNINTKLDGSNGKIYKTQVRTTVPGMSKDGKPGSVEVKIYAGEAGEEYNSIPLDFKITNFKGNAKYSKFYARSKGAITGGLKGKFPAISEGQKTIVLNELKISLQTKLFKKANDQIPNGFVLFKDAIFFNIDESVIDFVSSKNNTIPIKIKGTLYGLLFNENKLIKKIAENNVEKYDGSAVSVPNIRDLTFSLSTQAGLSDNKDTPFGDIKNINFNLSGATKIVWNVDVEKLLSDLLDKPKKDFNKILLQYPNIDSADLMLSPFWRRSIPDKVEDIKVIVNEPK